MPTETVILAGVTALTCILFAGHQVYTKRRRARWEAERQQLQRSEWQQSMQESPATRPGKEFVEAIAPSFESAKVIDEGGDSCELRGRVEGVPVRIVLSQSGRHRLTEAMIENRRGTLWLKRDHSKIPKEPDPHDDWARYEKIRVFIAKGIYVEDREETVEALLSVAEALGAEAKGWLTGEIERLRLEFLQAVGDRFEAEPDFCLSEHPDPVAYLGELVQFLVNGAQLFASGDGDMSAEPRAQIHGQGGGRAAALAPRVDCSYCGTVFLLDSSSRCPNCAGPYKG